MKAYTVAYTMFFGDVERRINLLANNKVDAYDKAAYDAIPKVEESQPYAVWVHSVTHGNGREQVFNTFEGKRF
jgi:hypothetical protein